VIKRNKKVLLFIVFVAGIAALRLSPLGGLLTFENLKDNRERLLSFVQDHYLRSAILYVVAYIVITALSIPGAGIMTLAGGFLFGVLPACLYIDFSATAGATFAFLIARYLLGAQLQEKYRTQLSAFNAEMGKNGSKYLLTLRMIPVFPFFVINFLSGLTNVTVRTFIWTTAVGIIPATAIFAYAGRQLGTINTVSEILSARVILALCALAALALFPVVFKRFKADARRQR
jgi:uncharacterized membrane protein YdjX (TVP38/TMEM64 family)